MDEDEISMRTIGLILVVLALPIMIVNTVLLSMPNPDIGLTGILILISTNMFIAGLILRHFPQENKGKRNENVSC